MQQTSDIVIFNTRNLLIESNFDKTSLVSVSNRSPPEFEPQLEDEWSNYKFYYKMIRVDLIEDEIGNGI
jgi:hypothetical protein